MGNLGKSLRFITEILPKLPYAITHEGKIYKINIEFGTIRYYNKKDTLISFSATHNYDSGIKMLNWLADNKVGIWKMKATL